MKNVDRILEMVECEFDKIGKKEELTKDSLPVLDTLSNIYKNIMKGQAYEFDGYSQRRPYDGNSYGKFYNGWMYDDSDRASYGGRNMRGYSRHDQKEHMMDQMERLMDDASPQERDVIQRAVDQIAHM